MRILLAGEKAVSWPYVSLTLQTMKEAGLDFTIEVLDNNSWECTEWRDIKTAKPFATRFTVPKGSYSSLKGATGFVEGDYSGASYLLAAGAVGAGPVTVTGLSPDSLQGDMAIIGILEKMGARVCRQESTVTVTPGALRGIDIDMGACPDLVPTVAVLAALASGETRITGAAHLKEKKATASQPQLKNLPKSDVPLE